MKKCTYNVCPTPNVCANGCVTAREEFVTPPGDDIVAKLIAVRLRQIASGALPLDDYAKERLNEAADRLVAQSESAPIVYLVECGFDYEGTDVKAIVTTMEEAEALQKKYRDQEHFSYDIVRITRWMVGEITEKRWEKT